jgi:hypothetical protein
MMKDIELAFKSTTFHSGHYSVRPVEAFDEKHTDQISVTLVRVQIHARLKAADFHSAAQCLKLRINYVNIAKREEKQERYFFRDSKVS